MITISQPETIKDGYVINAYIGQQLSGCLFYSVGEEGQVLLGFTQTFPEFRKRGVCEAMLKNFAAIFPPQTEVQGAIVEDRTLEEIKQLGLNDYKLKGSEIRFNEREKICQFYMANKLTDAGILVSELSIRPFANGYNPEVSFLARIS